jgi:hypothetical protein
MKEPLGWARVRPPGAYSLRRGAWYPVVDDNQSTEVVIALPIRTVVIPRGHLQIRRHRPERFSVVVREADDPNPRRGQLNDLGTIYAVCPSFGCRVRLSGHPDEMLCPECGRQFPIAWDDMC